MFDPALLRGEGQCDVNVIQAAEFVLTQQASSSFITAATLTRKHTLAQNTINKAPSVAAGHKT